MVGGVISLVRDKGDALELVVRGTGCERYETCAVQIPKGTGHDVKPGDQVWWQGLRVMWTPKENRGRLVEEVDGVLVGSGTRHDIVIERLSASYEPRI